MTRRHFNSTLASAAFLAPFMRPRRTLAAGSSAINRLIIMMTISPVRPVWNLADPKSFLFGPSMSSIKDKTIILDGLPMNDPSANHANPQSLTGQGFGSAKNSFDVAVALGLGGSFAIPNMVLGAGGQGSDLSLFWKGGQLAQPINDPMTAFNLAFATSAVSTHATSNSPDPALEMRRRQSILNLLSADIVALEDQNLTQNDLAKLQLHQASADQLKNRLNGTTSSSGGSGGGGGGGSSSGCKAPTLGTYDAGNNAQKNALLLQVGTEAVVCGITPVVGVVFGTHQGYTATSYETMDPSFNGDTHNQFCHGYPNADTANHEEWCAAQFASTVKTLAAAPGTTGGTMLDETIVLWARDMGDGQGHNSQKMPYVIAGGSSYFGYSATGKTLDLSSAVGGRTHEGVLRTIADAMQVTNLPDFGSKPTGGLITELKK